MQILKIQTRPVPKGPGPGPWPTARARPGPGSQGYSAIPLQTGSGPSFNFSPGKFSRAGALQRGQMTDIRVEFWGGAFGWSLDWWP